MSDYVPPLADIRFALSDAANLDGILATERYGHVDAATVFDVLAEVGRFMAEVVAPSNRDGDTIGSQWQPDGTVVAPPSFAAAYRKWVDAGYGAMPFDPDFGGGGFPWVTAIAVQEMVTSANMAFSLCPLLTQGAIDAIHVHGSDDQKTTYLPQMLTGEWTGIDEPHRAAGRLRRRCGRHEGRAGRRRRAGSVADHRAEDLHHLGRTRPGRQHHPPGAGPHARLASRHQGHLDVPRAEVPARRRRVRSGERNPATCVSIEHKLGIHGSPTCVMSYDGARRLARRRRARGHARTCSR